MQITNRIFSKSFFTLILLFSILFIIVGFQFGIFRKWKNMLYNQRTVEDVVKELESRVDSVFMPIFQENNIPYPPDNLVLLGLKEEQVLEVWTLVNEKPVLLKAFPFTTNSGTVGPKLKRGDGQIPEGIYKVVGFNPNSSYHLSLKINYPNEFDLKKAKEENRLDPGDNIFIHGKDKSIGCVAIGDESIEELFVLAAKSNRENITVYLLPYDLRVKAFKKCDTCPSWIKELYLDLKIKVNLFK